MISTRLYLDKRGIGADMEAPIKLCISRYGSSAYIPIGVRIFAHQWNRVAQKVIDRADKASLNMFIQSRKVAIDNIIYELTMQGKLTKMSATQVKYEVLRRLQPERDTANLFIQRFDVFARSRRAARTQEIYLTTIKRIMEFDTHADAISFDDISKDWINSFSSWMTAQGMSKNSKNIHLRNIRAVINDAIDNEITTNYPMRKVDMRAEETKKRNLSVEKLREFISHDVEEWQQRYKDYFIITFGLIGINPVDLLNLKHSNVIDGRIYYTRAKTGKKYNIRIEPEIQCLIDKYKGKTYLLSFLETTKTYRAFAGKADKGLKSIGRKEMVPNEKWKEGSRKHKCHTSYIPDFPELSIYWARHTWATIAYSLEIPDEVIAAALGHSHGNKTTAIYIDKSVARIDSANRRVLDYVFYGVNQDTRS